MHPDIRSGRVDDIVPDGVVDAAIVTRIIESSISHTLSDQP